MVPVQDINGNCQPDSLAMLRQMVLAPRFSRTGGGAIARLA
jgi:hypothetical protein